MIVLAFFRRRKPETVVQIETETDSPVRRLRQQNFKVSDECVVAFAAIAQAQGFSKVELFEDMVADRLEQLERKGVKVTIGRSERPMNG